MRLLHALLPFISTLNFTKSSSSHAPKSDDKTIEGLFNLYNFTESKIKEFKYNSEEKLPGEALDMFTVCDVDIREDSKELKNRWKGIRIVAIVNFYNINELILLEY